MKKLLALLIIVSAIVFVGCDDGSGTTATVTHDFAQNFDDAYTTTADWQGQGRAAVLFDVIAGDWIVETAGETVSIVNGALETNSGSIGCCDSTYWGFDLSAGGVKSSMKSCSFDITQNTGADLPMEFTICTSAWGYYETWDFIAVDGTSTITLDLTVPGTPSDGNTADLNIANFSGFYFGQEGNETFALDNFTADCQ